MTDYETLDPGIRDIVRKVNAAGFETTDSGDGVSKPRDWYDSGEALPFPHVVAMTTPATMVADAHRMQGVLGPGWLVEASYCTLRERAHLFARTVFDEEKAEAAATHGMELDPLRG